VHYSWDGLQCGSQRKKVERSARKITKWILTISSLALAAACGFLVTTLPAFAEDTSNAVQRVTIPAEPALTETVIEFLPETVTRTATNKQTFTDTIVDENTRVVTETITLEVEVAGPQGPEGPRGPQGRRGEKGDKGEQGEPGTSGSSECAAQGGSMQQVVFNSPGGQLTLFVCVLA
jgi:hypothetical protein